MPLVNVMVNGRAYTIACDEGEEEHLRDLAKMVDEKAREVLSSVGQVGDSRLILMAALLIADEHHGMMARLNEGGQKAAETEQLHLKAAEIEEQAAEALEQAAMRLEKIADGLARA
jgi:cell division protein ZapA